MSNTQKPELLMPAGDFEKMTYAFAYGADAVYLGIPRFSLRARENGFKSLEQVAEAVNYAHNLGKKVYVTANIFPHNHKLPSFTKYISGLLDLCKPDAFIMSDPGLIMMMREAFPDQQVHISVQANTLNYATAKFWQKVGATRIIVSREISIKEIKEIHDACPEMELESFVHGAICMAYSGRCLISNYLSNRDGNQGACSNSCRWEYKVYKTGEVQPQSVKESSQGCCQGQKESTYAPLEGQFFVKEAMRPDELFELDEDEHGSYLMNSKDLCAISSLKELQDAGVCSFKVEGRSKSIYYVAMITRAYRAAIDDMAAGKPFNPEVMRDIFATSNRGFIQGFLHGNPGNAGQEFSHGMSLYSAYRYCGSVKSYDTKTGRMNVSVSNPLKVGQEYELCTPAGNLPLSLKEIFQHNGQPVTEIHGGIKSCWIPFPNDPGPCAVIREAINTFDPAAVVFD